MIEIAPGMLVDNKRNIKIGYHHVHANGSEVKYYLTAKEKNNYKVSVTEVSENTLLIAS